MRRGRRNDIFDQPWVPIAAVIGVIAVIAIAAFFFLGIGSSGGQAASSASPSSAASSSGSSSSASVPVSSGKIDTTKIKDLPTVTVPTTGTYVKVTYIASFSGEYGMDGAMVTIRDSGEKAYLIENANRTVSAVFKKLDGSTKMHEIKAEIWKDGKVMKYATNTSPYGEVRISYTP
jgi:hypothetical protein